MPYFPHQTHILSALDSQAIKDVAQESLSVATHFTIQQYLVFLGCLFLGQVFHLIVKANSIRKKHEIANLPFKVGKDFIKKDMLEILGTVLGGIIILVGYSEIIGFYPKLGAAQKMFFMLAGYAGSSWVLAAFSKADKSVMDYIDKKTNIADFITNQNTMDEYYYQLKDINDEVKQNDGTYIAADQWAIQEGLTFDTNNLQLVTDSVLTDSITLRHPDFSNSLSIPVRRPK